MNLKNNDVTGKDIFALVLGVVFLGIAVYMFFSHPTQGDVIMQAGYLIINCMILSLGVGMVAAPFFRDRNLT